MLNEKTIEQISADVELGFPSKDEYRSYCRRLIGEVQRLQTEAGEERCRAHFLENSVGVWSRDFELLQGRFFQLEARARELVNAMHEFPEGDWTEVLAALKEALARPSP